MLKRNAFIAAVAATLSIAAFAAPSKQSPDFYGQATETRMPDLKVNIDPQTKWVNVTNGQTVTFSDGSQSFSWHFDTLHHDDNVDLAEIAPKGFNAGRAHVYVTPNAAELG